MFCSGWQKWHGMFYPGGGQKWHGIFCPGRQKLHGMFCPGWQINLGCFVQGAKKWHGMFCPGMFCPSLNYHLSLRSLFCLFWGGRFRQVLLYVVFFEGCSPGALVSPEGGSMMIQDGDGTSFMAEAIFICNSDYELSENSYSRFCLSDGSWSGTDPTCDPIGMYSQNSL